MAHLVTTIQTKVKTQPRPTVEPVGAVRSPVGAAARSSLLLDQFDNNLAGALKQMRSPRARGQQPRRARSASPRQRRERECVICMDKWRSVRFSCGHRVTCADCAARLMAEDGATCPLCRQPLQSRPPGDVSPMPSPSAAISPSASGVTAAEPWPISPRHKQARPSEAVGRLTFLNKRPRGRINK
mmetsp:Transcript_70857/g.167063  ORF Transcript_70857/g.167063 Transcript_70857/m.167063 type:complete len:185 (-) Transcript_70857:11-565(-)